MRLLILGYSSIAQRRVIRAAAQTAAISEVSIASKSRAEPNEGWPKRGHFFADYDLALRESQADIVYVSLPNAMHEHWVLAALASGKHVLVDKPAMTTREACERGVKQARLSGRMLAEATVFDYHPHFEALRGFLAVQGPLTHVDAQFIIPPLPAANFRNHTEFGGGCLLDMSPYAAGLMRILGGGLPSHVTALAGTRHPETGVDMGFSVQARLANGGIFSGHFSFEGEYQNRLLIVARSGSVMIERVFSPPADHRMEWRQHVRNVETVVTFEAADTFARFLDAATRAIAADDHEPLHRDLLADAECRARIAAALADPPTLVR
ncbi:Gfo/Idh/MocA family protein [Bradyrhizobium sp.]|uniref:Gfo/Idh/MocA family protein n=1 Tax=Bradyrhizobium sp. TaxID=376 RepID=UPI002732337F|nr:Gfo/Idh/MocA family oxidoreductase [Bradyrhizobium sp.]MDP3074838.1 Gfo/Idh/MocA family oxidoreductase [Bradyrhizobium sp.]